MNATGGNDNNNGTSWEYAKLSIKNATGTVNANGVINLANGNYTGPNNRGITIDRNMTIMGESQTGTIIDAEKQNRIFTINQGISLIIQKLTLQNGNITDNGGAIMNYGTLNVISCTFNDNTANWGGAIENDYGSNCSVIQSTFTHNSGSYGGAIDMNSGTLTITNCNFNGNQASGNGGAIWSFKCNITRSTFTDNTANNWGGAIRSADDLDAQYNRFYNNSAPRGAAIDHGEGSFNIENNWWGNNNPVWSSLIHGTAPVWWIYMNLTATPANPLYNDQINLIANFNYHSNGTDITPLTGGYIPDSEVFFTSNDGSLNPLSKTTMNGLASSIFTPTTSGSVTVNATLDNQICSLTINVGKGIPSVSVDSVHNFAGQTVNLTATIVDQNGNPIKNGQVTFIWGNLIPVSATVSNGKAKIDNWTIPSNWNVGNYTILVTYIENSNYADSSGTGNLTIDQTPTNLTTSNITGNKGKTVTLNATLTDYYGTPLNNKIIEFYVNNAKVGENTTNTNGLATLNYNITQIGGIYNTTALFAGDNTYAASNGNGTLKVPQSSIYVTITPSKTNPTVGEIITLTFKLGNNGPDPADDVVFTYVIPEGMEFVSIETEPGYPQATYNATTRTITWPLGTVPKLDPWIKLNVLVLNSGAFNINPTVTTITYDPTLGNDIQHITINAVQAASATSTTRTIEMQETGIPITGLILAILAVLGGLIAPKRK